MTRRIFGYFAAALVLAALPGPVGPDALAAQEEEEPGWTVGVAGELVSQYIWRGLELDDDPALQPDVWIEKGNLSFGAWASIPLGGDFSEVDLYVSWYQDLGTAGELTLSLFDYFYPSEHDDLGELFEFGGVEDGEQGGAHTLELMAEYAPAALPLDFQLGWNVYNDPDHSLIGGVGSTLDASLFELRGEVFFQINDSPYYYEAAAGDVMQYSIQASRGFTLGNFGPYVSAAFMRSGIMDENYWVFALGF